MLSLKLAPIAGLGVVACPGYVCRDDVKFSKAGYCSITHRASCAWALPLRRRQRERSRSLTPSARSSAHLSIRAGYHRHRNFPVWRFRRCGKWADVRRRNAITGRGDRQNDRLTTASGVHSICILTLGRDLNVAARWGQSCSKLSADEFRSTDTRRECTIQDNSSTFRQALSTSFS
jgi:hypothetical protein